MSADAVEAFALDPVIPTQAELDPVVQAQDELEERPQRDREGSL